MLSTKNTKLLQVYIPPEDYLRLKQISSGSRGMGNIVRMLIRAYLTKTNAPAPDPQIQEIVDGTQP